MRFCKVCKIELNSKTQHKNVTHLFCKKHFIEYIVEMNRKHRAKFHVRRKRYEAKNDKTTKRKKQLSETTIRMMKKYPEKLKARTALRYAVKTGKIKKESCSSCGEVKVQGHHPNYSKPLEVVWLCQPHHVQVHHYGKVI